MSKKSFIDSVEVKNPCSEDWTKMRGNARVRFCDHCAKEVKNLSAVTRKEAMRIVRASDGGICIRYIPDPVTKRPMFANQLFQITRRTPGLAAGVMTASLSLASISYAQSETAPPSPPMSSGAKEDSQKTNSRSSQPIAAASISGTVSDPAGAVIPNATVSIFSVNGTKTATSNDDGVYKFEKLEPGTYRVEFSSPGFKPDVKQVTLSDANESTADAALGIELRFTVDVIAENAIETGSGMGGAMASVQYSSPLTKAVSNDNVDLVKELIAQGENVNGKDSNYGNLTPLFVAVENGSVEIAKILLEAGAKVNARDKEKQTPLMRLDDDATPELVELLLTFGAKVVETDTEGNTALIIAAQSAKPEVIKKLIGAGSDIDLANKSGQTALMTAVTDGNLEVVRTLLESGAKVNLRNKDGESAWDVAANEEAEKLLESFGAIKKPKERVAPDK